MKVSFVIPSFNQGSFIGHCVRSCMEQGVADAEIVVMDGLSTDSTVDVLKEFGSKVDWVSKKDAGQADAVNQGVAKATGDVIAWINSDDYYPTAGVVAKVMKLFDSPDVDIVYGNGMLVSPERVAVRRFDAWPLSRMAELLVHPVSFVLQPAVFFRRSLFLEVGGLRTDLHWSLDYDLWLRMFPRARGICYVPQVLACGTVHPGAKSIRGMKTQIHETRALKRAHWKSFDTTLTDRLRVEAGHAKNLLYYALVKAGLWDYRPDPTWKPVEMVDGEFTPVRVPVRRS